MSAPLKVVPDPLLISYFEVNHTAATAVILVI